MSDSNKGKQSADLAQQNDSISDSPASNASSGNNEAGTNQDRSPPSIEVRPPAESVNAQTHTEQASEHEQAELDAQQDMAFWAMFMFFATLATVVISGAALWLLKKTLDATSAAATYAQTMAAEAQKATKAAADAAKASTKASDAMIEANSIARASADEAAKAAIRAAQISEAQQRARISPFARISVTSFGESWQVTILGRNIGASLANFCCCGCRIFDSVPELPPNLDEFGPSRTLAPNEENQFTVVDFAGPEQFVAGRIEYQNIFGNMCVSNFCFGFATSERSRHIYTYDARPKSWPEDT